MKSNPLILIMALVVMLASATVASAQKKPHEKPEKPEKPEKTKIKVVEETIEREEKAVSVAPNVVITLCMDSGQITVRGGDRREVRARVPKGTEIDFHGGADATPESPAARLEMMVAEAADEDEPGPHFGQCTGAADIELDVPRDATLFFKSENGEFDIDGVAEAHIESQHGPIHIRRATRAIEATTIDGDVLLEDSSGRVRLESFGGSVEAVNVSKTAESDFFRAKTISNDVVLENVSHSRVEASTISGEVIMRGPLARAGRYDLRTTSGDITLTMPVDSSFQLIAKVSEGGEIVTDFPLKYAGGISSTGLLASGRMVGTHGKGDATINLVSFNGTLRLRKQ
jgi:Putative adhesin